MALTATGGNLIAAQQARQSRLSSSINSMIKAIGIREEREANERKRLLQQANTYTDNFVQQYGAMDESSNAQWNAGAREWVSKAAAKQNELYMKAYGPDGTVEDRNKLRDQKLKDNSALKAMGVFMVQGNSNTSIMNKNNIAQNKGVALGLLPRGTSTDLMQFQQGLTNNAINKDGVSFNVGEDGQMSMSGTYMDGVSFNRNVSADAAAQSEGIQQLDPITEEDLIEKVLGARWHDGKGALGNNFEPKTVTKQTWSKDGTKQTTIVTQENDPAATKESLLKNYSSVLEADIKGSNFPKLWDQLYMNGYIKDNDGTQMEEGKVAWKTVKQINNMTVDQFTAYAKDLEGGGDYDGDGSITIEDQKLFADKMNDAAKNALANYYSESLAPQEDKQITSKTTEYKTTDDYSVDQRKAYEAYRNDFKEIESSIPTIAGKNGINRTNAVISTLGGRAKNYYSGKELNDISDEDNFDSDGVYKYDANTGKTSEVISSTELSKDDDLMDVIINASSLPKGVQGYMKSHTKGGGLSYDTKEAAIKAYGKDEPLMEVNKKWKPVSYGKVK